MRSPDGPDAVTRGGGGASDVDEQPGPGIWGPAELVVEGCHQIGRAHRQDAVLTAQGIRPDGDCGSHETRSQLLALPHAPLRAILLSLAWLDQSRVSRNCSFASCI